KHFCRYTCDIEPNIKQIRHHFMGLLILLYYLNYRLRKYISIINIKNSTGKSKKRSESLEKIM
ncbi:MAG: hypothetical protein ACPL3B_02630, partial [Fervidobacterium sp.]